MTRNIRVFLLTEAVLAACGGFILPIYVLYYRYFSITLFQVALLAAVFEASVLVFELPTGLLADRFGRKLSVLIGFALFAISGLIFVLYRSFIGFIVAEIIFGLSEAFISGAGEALAVDSIPEPEKQTLLQKMYVARSRIKIAVTSLFMIAAGYLFAETAIVTFIPVIFGGLIGVLISLGFVSPHRTAETEEPPGFFRPMTIMFGQLRLFSILKVIFIVSIIANFAFEGADQYWQVLGTEVYDIDVNYFGFFTAAGAVMAFLLVGPVVKKAGGLAVPLLILLLSGVVISLLPSAPAMLLPYLLIAYFFTKQMMAPLFSVEINRRIGSEGRATFLSGYNLTCSIGEVISGVIVGLIASRLGLPVVFIVCGTVLVIASTVSLLSAAIRKSAG